MTHPIDPKRREQFEREAERLYTSPALALAYVTGCEAREAEIQRRERSADTAFELIQGERDELLTQLNSVREAYMGMLLEFEFRDGENAEELNEFQDVAHAQGWLPGWLLEEEKK